MKRDYSMYSPEMQGKIVQWQRGVTDKTITIEEMREAIAALRSERHTAIVSAATSGTGVKKTRAAAKPKTLPQPQRSTASLLAGFLAPPSPPKDETK